MICFDSADADLYSNAFGITLPKTIYMNFKTVGKEFKKLVSEQKKLYLSVIKSTTLKKVSSKKTSSKKKIVNNFIILRVKQ